MHLLVRFCRASSACRTQAVHHKPCALVGNAERAMDLMGANAFLRGREQEQRGKPLRQRNLAALEYRLDRDRELLAALAALVEARTVRFAIERRHVFARSPAVRADRPFRPNPCLQPRPSLGVVGENRVLKVRSDAKFHFHVLDFGASLPCFRVISAGAKLVTARQRGHVSLTPRARGFGSSCGDGTCANGMSLRHLGQTTTKYHLSGSVRFNSGTV